MCEVIGYLLSFTLGIIAGGVGLYYKLYNDITLKSRNTI